MIFKLSDNIYRTDSVMKEEHSWLRTNRCELTLSNLFAKTENKECDGGLCCSPGLIMFVGRSAFWVYCSWTQFQVLK